MIYYISNDASIKDVTYLNIEEALKEINSWKVIQFDTETTGLDVFIDNLLLAQFGNKEKDIQIVVDCTTIDFKLFKNILETHTLLGHNLAFDLKWCYKYNIIPRKVIDTMICEQTMRLGFPSINLPINKEYDFPTILTYNKKDWYYRLSFSLKAVLKYYLGIDMDKTVRESFIGSNKITKEQIIYAAYDVKYLEDIFRKQYEKAKQTDCLKALALENNFVPCLAYLEFCGIKLDENKWNDKMQKDLFNLNTALNNLNNWLVKWDTNKKYHYIDNQGDLFNGFSLKPIVTLNWSSPKQVIQLVKELGFNTATKSKHTGEDSDSVVEKILRSQKGIDDEFLDLYFKYKECCILINTFGKKYINAINPITNRIHTTFRQIGTASGRMACGSTQPNEALIKYKQLKPDEVSYPQLQNLPADEETRAAFVAEDGNVLIDCDYSALESRLGADIYNEKAMLKEFLEGSGDMHSLCASLVFKEELKGIPIKDIKKVRPDLRKKVKSVEFAKQLKEIFPPSNLF